MAGLWVSNEFALPRPAAFGRPPPAKGHSASAQADAGRGAPKEADFQSAEAADAGQEGVEGIRPGEALRPVAGLWASNEFDL